MGMMGKMMEGIMAKASEKYDVVELDKDIYKSDFYDETNIYEVKELTLTEVNYILMNSDISKIIIIHKE